MSAPAYDNTNNPPPYSPSAPEYNVPSHSVPAYHSPPPYHQPQPITTTTFTTTTVTAVEPVVMSQHPHHSDQPNAPLLGKPVWGET